MIQDNDGKVTELHCHYDVDTLGGKKPADGKKVKGIIHWLPVAQAKDACIRLYDRLFNVENPAALVDFVEALNPDSLKVLSGAKIEACLVDAQPGEVFQFTRLGYYVADLHDHTAETPVFNCVVNLKDTWQTKA